MLGLPSALLWGARVGFVAALVFVLIDAPPLLPVGNEWLLPLAACLLAHVFRFLRLALLAGQDLRSPRALTIAYAVGAPMSAYLPFRLGDIYRIMEIGRAVGSVELALGLVWAERILDAVALVLLAVFVWLLWGVGGTEAVPRALAAAAFLTGSAVIGIMLGVFRERILRGDEHAPNGRISSALWWLTGSSLRVLQFTRARLTARIGLVFVITMLAWASEIIALMSAPLSLMLMVRDWERLPAALTILLGGVGPVGAYGALIEAGLMILLGGALLALCFSAAGMIVRRSRQRPEDGGLV